MPSVFAWKALGTLKLPSNCSYYNPKIVQATCKKFEADISDLKNRLKTQETETRKANAKFESSIAAQEKLKKKFEAERKTWVEEKAALVSRAEQAEKALTERTAERSGLKRHVSQMVAAIFGKSISPALDKFVVFMSHNSHHCQRLILLCVNRSKKRQPQSERADQAEGRVHPGGATLHRVTTRFGRGGPIQ